MTIKYLPEDAAATEQAFAMLLIRLGERHYGLPLDAVERIMPMAQVLALPDTGDGLLGMLNLQALPRNRCRTMPRKHSLQTRRITTLYNMPICRISFTCG